MMLEEINYQTERQILEVVMTEMANLFPIKTGLPTVIWFGEVGGQHGPRIKVSNIKGKFAQNDNFDISVEKEPRVLTPRAVKLKVSDIEDIFDWIKINYDDLMKLWEIYESGDGDVDPLLASLKKV